MIGWHAQFGFWPCSTITKGNTMPKILDKALATGRQSRTVTFNVDPFDIVTNPEWLQAAKNGLLELEYGDDLTVDGIADIETLSPFDAFKATQSASNALREKLVTALKAADITGYVPKVTMAPIPNGAAARDNWGAYDTQLNTGKASLAKQRTLGNLYVRFVLGETDED